MVFTFESSSVMCPSQAGSMKPAVLWMSRPSRPDAIAARMSRSESTTVAKYGLGRAREREDGFAQIRPCGDHIVGAVDPLARKPPEDLNGARARGFAHRDVGVRVADDDALL